MVFKWSSWRCATVVALVALSSPQGAAFSPCRSHDVLSPSISESALHATKTLASRREAFLPILTSAVAAATLLISKPDSSEAAETIGKAEDCKDSLCVGVWDGLLAGCPHDGLRKLKGGAGCVCSQDDTPGVFSEPWDYSEAPNNSMDWKDQMTILVPAIEFVSTRRGDKVEILLQDGRYLRVKFTDKASGESSLGEFYFTPNDTTVQFRVGSIEDQQISLWSIRNMERCELIRKELRYLKIPVLRNRSRSLFFGESEFDNFGPGSAMLGPPSEMSTGEVERGRGSADISPKFKIDLLQQFPVAR